MKKYNEEWVDYYKFLEVLRQSGVTNMYGAVPYLQEYDDLNDAKAGNILSSWMENYEQLIEDGVINRGD